MSTNELLQGQKKGCTVGSNNVLNKICVKNVSVIGRYYD